VEPFRAVTHNKGIMNGVDAVVLATGNDFRAVGGFMLTLLEMENILVVYRTKIENGIFTFDGNSSALGTVGGLTSLHPLVKWL
jgi:hydroxymethylglutaryl-CoA reductase